MTARILEARADPLLEPCYSPVLDLASGLVVGAELLAPSPAAASSTAASAAWAGSLPMLTRLAAQAFAFGRPADEGWWVAAGLRPGQVASPSAPDVVAELLDGTGLPPERLIVPVSYPELAHAVRGGTAAALGALGVRFSVEDFAADEGWRPVIQAAPVASVQLGLAGLRCSEPDHLALVRSVVASAASFGTDVIGRGVDSDEQLALAGEAGVALVEGFWLGIPGSLAKLVGTWARLPTFEASVDQPGIFRVR